MIPSVQSEFLFIVYLIGVIKQYLTIVLVVFVFEFRNFLLGRVIFSKLTQIKRIVLHWQVLIQGKIKRTATKVGSYHARLDDTDPNAKGL